MFSKQWTTRTCSVLWQEFVTVLSCWVNYSLEPSWSTIFPTTATASISTFAPWNIAHSSVIQHDTLQQQTMKLHNTIKRSLFSFLRTLTMWHCPHCPPLPQHLLCSNRLTPACRAHSSKREPAAAGLLLFTNAGTGRQTDTITLHRPCSHTLWAVPIMSHLQTITGK